MRKRTEVHNQKHELHTKYTNIHKHVGNKMLQCKHKTPAGTSTPRRLIAARDNNGASPEVPRRPRKATPSATPAMQNENQCHQVPRLPSKRPRQPRRQTGPKRVTRAKPSAIRATPATQSEGQCHQAPCLPHKGPRRPQRQTGPKRVTRASSVSYVPRLLRKAGVE